MLVDIRFKQLADERKRALSMPTPTSMPIPSVTTEEPQPVLFPQPQRYEPVGPTPGHMSMPIPSVMIEEPQPNFPSLSIPVPPSLHARSMSTGPSPVLFVPPTSLYFFCSDIA